MRRLLAAEVVVDLAERDAGRLGDAPRREVRVAVGEQAGAGGGEDRARGCRPSPGPGAPRGSAVVSPCRPPRVEHTTHASRGDRVDRGQDEQRRPAAGSGAGPTAGSSRSRSGRRARASPCRLPRPTPNITSISDQQQPTQKAPWATPIAERLEPLGRAAPAVDDEPERAAALIEAAVAERAELPQAGGQQRRADDQLGVLGEPGQRLDGGVDAPIGRSRRRARTPPRP